MKAMGLLEGMKLARLRGWMEVVLKSDCQRVIVDLQNGTKLSSELSTVYDNIRSFASSFRNCSFSFVNRNCNQAAHILARRAQY